MKMKSDYSRFIPNSFDRKSSSSKPNVKPKLNPINSNHKNEINEPEIVSKCLQTSTIDFKKVSSEIGYVKSRNLLKQMSVDSHQAKVNAADAEAILKMRPQRVLYFSKLSATTGEPAIENPIDKLANMRSKGYNSSAVKGNQNNSDDNNSSPSHESGETHESGASTHQEDIHIALTRSLGTDELVLPQMRLSSLPSGMGDTLFLQTAHLRRVSCPRNEIASLLSPETPQLSCAHFRYVQDLNLSGNKIRVLPAEMSVLTALTSLDVSANQLSRLPERLYTLINLQSLNVAGNNFADIPTELTALTSLTSMDLSNNLFTTVPRILPKLRRLRALNLSKNYLQQAGIQPILMRHGDLWHRFTHPETGDVAYINIFTRERLKDTNRYDGKGIERLSYLHELQPRDSPHYNKRRSWLSICQVNEWDPVVDSATGHIYYVNHVSGDTQWTIPETLEQWAVFSELRTLNLSNNSLRILPKSLGSLSSLTKLHLERNRISALPYTVGCLKELQRLLCFENNLRFLPNSMTECTALEELHLQSNVLERLPELGVLPKLKKLFVTHNHLHTLPSSLGFCTTLTELQVQENPLEDPPYSEVEKGMAQLQWVLRQRQLVEQRGLPPAMTYHAGGVGEEVNMLYPDYLDTIQRLIREGKPHNSINLQLMGLRGIPVEVMGLTALKSLRLDVNLNLGEGLDFTTSLSSLKTLSLRYCKLNSLPESVKLLRKLRSLDLQQNSLCVLPKSFTKLSNLKYLNLSRNHLYSLPEGLKQLRFLETLILEGNFLESLPMDLGSLSELKILNASKNRIQILPAEISALKHLKALNLERNLLPDLPVGIQYLSLTVLRVGYNRIEWLPDDFFEAELGEALEEFSIPENNLLELPMSISCLKCLQVPVVDDDASVAKHDGLLSIFSSGKKPTKKTLSTIVKQGDQKVNPLSLVQSRSTGGQSLVSEAKRKDTLVSVEKSCRVELESNPLISPPTALRVEGLYILQKYMRIRQYRLSELQGLLADAGFDFLVENATPIAHEVLDDDGSTFLYPEDMQKFDHAVDRYINGPFYMFPASAEEMVEKLILLREERELYIYTVVLTALIDAIESVRDNLDFGSAVLTVTKRKWGRNKEFVKCYVLAEEALLQDTPPNTIHKNGRPALFHSLQTEIPSFPFNMTTDLLTNAVKYFRGPYDQVADIEQFSFRDCDCVDPHQRFMAHNPCIKTAIVIAKKIYSREEAAQREKEELAFIERFEEIEETVQLWLGTQHGSKLVDELVKERRKLLLRDISLKSELLLREEVRLKRCRLELERIQKRKQQFEQGLLYEQHQIKNATEAIKLVVIADNKIQNQLNRTMVLKEDLQQLKIRKKLTDDDMRNIACDELIQKYCFLAEQEMVRAFRIESMRANSRRLWDGEDGEAYERWYHTEGKGLAVFTLAQANGEDLKALKQNLQNVEGISLYESDTISSMQLGGQGMEEFDFNWDGCDNMAKYSSEMWDLYRTTHESTMEKSKGTNNVLNNGLS